MDNGITYLDNSMRKSMMCSLQVWLRYLMHRSTHITNKDLFSGSCGHEAVAEYHKTGNRLAAVQKFDETYKEWSIANVPPTDGKSWQTMREVINIWAWRRDVSPPYQVVEGTTEMFVKAPLDESGEFVYDALLDAMVTDSLGHAIEETKFTGSMQKDSNGNSVWLENFHFDTQLTGQLFIAKTAYPQLNIRHVHINGLECRKPVGVNTKSTKCPTHKKPYTECRHEHIVTATQAYSREPEELELFRGDALRDARTLKKMKVDYPDLGYAHLLPQEGKKYPWAACQRCEFRGFCRGPIKGELLEAGTQEVIWGPAVGKAR